MSKALWVCTLFFLACSHGAQAPVTTPPPETIPVPRPTAQDTPITSTPLLRLNPSMHTARINRLAVDRQERFAVTCSDDKSVLVWDLASGQLQRRIRLPAGPGNIGKAYAVALSPDGETIAVGGWTSKTVLDHFIYLYQRRSGKMRYTIAELENVINHLAYSPDGCTLAATLWGQNGLRLFNTDDYQLIYADRDYGASSYWASWLGNDALVTSSLAGLIRRYQRHVGDWRLADKADVGGGPYGLSVHPDGTRLAVGFGDEIKLALLELPGLIPLAGPDTSIVSNGNVALVTWSRKGDRLWAGGQYDVDGYNPVVCWPEGGGEPVRCPVTTNTVMDMHPLAGGDLVVASGDGLTRLSPQGEVRWQQLQPLADFRGQSGDTSIRVSHDGGQVAFGFKPGGGVPAWWDLGQMTLTIDPQPSPGRDDMQGAIVRHDALDVADWTNTDHPTLNGRELTLKPYEASRSLAISPDGASFVLGTEWSLRCFDADGMERWKQSVPGAAWAVAISGDGCRLVAGLRDGTLRWYDYDSGMELLALFPHADRKTWVAWTPEGFFASSSPEANRLFGYQLNNGHEQAPDFIGADQLYDIFYRPDLVLAKFEGRDQEIQNALAGIGDVRRVLPQRPPRIEVRGTINHRIAGTRLTLPLTLINQGGGIGEIVVHVNGVRQRTRGGTRKHVSEIRQDLDLDVFVEPATDNKVTVTASNGKGQANSESLVLEVTSTAPPPPRKPRLVGLAIGIENYQDESLKLKYAIEDVKAFKQTLEQQGRELYREVRIDILPDATYEEIQAAFTEAQDPKRVGADDVFVLYLSGHGVTDNGNYHFLTQNFIWSSPRALEHNTIDSKSLNAFMAGIQARKAVLILDPCYAGSYKPDITASQALYLAGKAGPEDKQAIGRMAEATAVERLNQLSGRAVFYASTSRDVALEGYNRHGLYTALLLEGLQGKASRDDNYVSLHELGGYLEKRMPEESKRLFKIRLYPMAHVPTSFNFTTRQATQ